MGFPGRFNTVLKKLQEFANSNEHFTVYDTKTFPGRWHCNNSRIGPITVVASLGYAFQDVVTNIVETCGGNLTSKFILKNMSIAKNNDDIFRH